MRKDAWTDAEARTALKVRNRGGTIAEAAEAVGRSRNSAIGFFNRANKESDAILCKCRKPENRDGAGWEWAE